MPLFYSHTVDRDTRLAVWHIEEDEAFFLERVPVSRKITHPHKRLQHLAGRYLLQYLFPGFPIDLVQIADTRKPFLENDSHHFSISHCANYAAAIVSTNRRVGIDVEEQSPQILRVQHKFMSDAERQLLQKAADFFPTLIWSAKESMYKWYSLGEVDFQQHLQIQNIAVKSPNAGRVDALFCKNETLALQLPYMVWEDIVLTWVYQ